jgi:hypothetical protein
MIQRYQERKLDEGTIAVSFRYIPSKDDNLTLKEMEEKAGMARAVRLSK